MADAAVAQFTEITGSSPETAGQYLQLADQNLETAMQLYFENGGAELQAHDAEARTATTTTTGPPPSAPSRPPRNSDGHDVIHIDSDDDDSDSNTPIPRSAAPPPAESTFDDDLAMARRLQEEMYSGGGGGGDFGGGGGGGGDDVRAPMARTTETLVGQDAGSFGIGGSEVAQEQLRQLAATNRGRRGMSLFS